MTVATGLAIGSQPKPELAQRAVSEAMQKAGLEIANSVLLFLTSEFARDPLPAIKAAGKAANCVQVLGCSAPGIFTEQDWVLDAPAVAAMVFGGGLGLAPVHDPVSTDLMLVLTAPNAINITWLSGPGARFGGVSGDATGQGPFSVWHSSKASTSGRAEVSLKGVTGVIEASHGVRMLSKEKRITSCNGHDLYFHGGKPALASLQSACQEVPLPLHRLMAGIADSSEEIAHGQYRLAALVGANEQDRSVTLARTVEPGQLLFWALRETDAAQQDMADTLARMATRFPRTPQFGLLFSCLGRGPYFYTGVDRDLEILLQKFPGMPLIGLYGNGEIAPINGVNELLQYSAVLGLFHDNI